MTFLKILKWTGIVLVGLFILAEIIRWPFRMQNEKTAQQVAKIHATKLTMDDVMGKNLPPAPGAEADKTIPGVDANHNGIRDDVELAIFKAYPNSAKTRAVLLQYALALQMMAIQPILNTEVATSVIQEKSRAYECIGDNDTLRHFVDAKQLNTKERKEWDENFYHEVGSYAESEKNICDIDLSTL